MPTYEYACDACGQEFEQEQSIKDAAIKVCPICGKRKVRRLISQSSGFILKGGGWYSDLYSGPSNQSTSEGETTSAPSADSSSADSSSSTEGSPKSESKNSAGDASKPESKSSKPETKAKAKPKPKKQSSKSPN